MKNKTTQTLFAVVNGDWYITGTGVTKYFRFVNQGQTTPYCPVEFYYFLLLIIIICYLFSTSPYQVISRDTKKEKVVNICIVGINFDVK